jgi:predicted dienelactone hydrolase
MNDSTILSPVGGLATQRSIVSVKPVALPAPQRGLDLHVKVSAPIVGEALPVILFSHGFGSSFDGYGPLTDHWAANGFFVVQPTHLDSRTVGLPATDPRTASIWRSRVNDMRNILDHLDVLERAVPGLSGRIDRSRIAAAGHSFGGQTAANLLGLRVVAPDGAAEDLSDARVTAGVLLATAGKGGADLTPFAAEHFPFMNPDFQHMTTPALVIAGDQDALPMLTVRGPAWCTDPYFLSPGPKALLTLFGAEHSLGGIAGYDAKETTDEEPERVGLVQRATLAYLRSALDPTDPSWAHAVAELGQARNALGRIDEK